jgi:hypothetical protein
VPVLKGSGGVNQLGFWTLSIVRYSKEYDVSERGLFPYSVGRAGGTNYVGPLVKADLKEDH